MLIGKRRYVIGVLSPVVGGYYFGRVLAGIARTVRPDGHRVVAVQTYPADLEREQFPDRPPGTASVSLGQVDGVIVITSAVNEATLLRIEDDGTPIVLISGRATGVDAPVVTPDNEGGTRAAVEHLIAHGHREIGFLGSLRQADIVQRHEAYLATLLAHGITPRPEWLYRTADNQEASAATVAQALVGGPGLPTTATVAATDRNAIGFSRALRVQGLSLPGDQAIVGFDHSEAGARVRPRLASVDPHHDQVGELAVSLLLARIRGERVAGQHLSRSTLVTRESCGCLDARAGALVGGLPAQEGSTAWRRLGEVARATFDGAEARLGLGADLDSWLRGVQRVFRSAAALGQPPTQATLTSLAESTRALRPHPEALEQLIPALRSVEDEFREQVRRGQVPTVPAERPHAVGVAGATAGATGQPGSAGPPGVVAGSDPTTKAARAPSRAARARAVTHTATDVLVALSAGCTQTLLARSGRLERTITDQYELDLDLLHADGRAIRALTWLPRGHPGPATLALWSDAESAPVPGTAPASARINGARTLEIVGTTAVSRKATALVGTHVPVSEFPPPALAGEGVVFVVPVTFDQSDWGMLAIGGGVDIHATSSRDKYDHWAAMVAVALDREDRLTSLQRQQAALAEAASRERALVLDLRTEVERNALVQDVALEGTWDWDIATGQVFYSRTWRALVGLPDDASCTGIEEWTGRVHPQDVRAVQTAIARQLAGAAEPLDLEHRLIAADGREMWVRCRATTVTDDAGVRARMIGVLMDVTGMPARERRGVAR
ncbi:substrate-binding domain-containing protein [Promicromonospora iranensis]|uniref:DNA-binding LacI/PurR family transcriptional regulator/PAS domain-containing protein n=1 Tax=Promicromonospora iranensis TaxID=1105144 RepID=A0ABU2CNW1_9MICO|nr:substrate-binding domain-containing protein [Promicromonospora iranensis]MDR7383033.1 DNA-binding LacI/PurR family transcriptional regulator/PAS domain-containing protein [Promicromonospora iranensis]